MPPYSLQEGGRRAARACGFKSKVLQEHPLPRLYLYCDFEGRKYMPRRSCEFYMREPGVD